MEAGTLPESLDSAPETAWRRRISLAWLSAAWRTGHDADGGPRTIGSNMPVEALAGAFLDEGNSSHGKHVARRDFRKSEGIKKEICAQSGDFAERIGQREHEG